MTPGTPAARWLLTLALAVTLTACKRRVEPPGAEVSLPVARAGSTRFVVIGDSGEANDTQASVFGAMGKACAVQGCDFTLLLGDNIYPSGPKSADDPVLEQVLGPLAVVGTPVFAALGNHDDGGTGLDPERGDAEIAWTKHPAWWRTPARYYRLSAGELDVIVLDTSAILFGRDAQQRVDVARWLAMSTAKWKVVAGHHPRLSNGDHGDAGRYDHLPAIVPVASGRRLKRFLDEIVCGKATAYLAGHDHERQWMSETCQGTELLVSGAGAKPKALASSRPARFESDAPGFLYVDASSRGLVAAFVTAEGRIDFSRTLPP